MARKITMNLSSKSMQAAIKELKAYQSDLNRKCEELCRRLIEAGIEVANAKIGESPLGKTITLQSKITPEKAGCKAVLIAVGQIKQSEGYEPFNTLLAVEFGAGIHYNKTENPKANEFGMGVGTFPGQIHAFQEEGWYYLGNDNQWHHTYGVKATMPMYHASKEIREKVVPIAREVFKS